MKYGFQLCQEWNDSIKLANGIVEIKYDGIMAIAENGELFNRRGINMSHKYPEIHVNPDLVLVGEVVVFNERGVSDFHLAQSRTQNKKENELRAKMNPAVFMAFDILEVEGKTTTPCTEIERKGILANCKDQLGLGDNVRYDGYAMLTPKRRPFANGQPKRDNLKNALETVEKKGLEGLIIKDGDAPYIFGAKSKSSRPPHWFKLVPWYDVVVPIDSFEATGVGKGFVLYITTPHGYKQKVVCNSVKMRALVESGEAKWVKVKFKSVEPSGAFRQPSTVEVFTNESMKRALDKFGEDYEKREHYDSGVIYPIGAGVPVCGRNQVAGVIISQHPSEGKMVKGQIIQACPNYEACGFMAALKK